MSDGLSPSYDSHHPKHWHHHFSGMTIISFPVSLLLRSNPLSNWHLIAQSAAWKSCHQPHPFLYFQENNGCVLENLGVKAWSYHPSFEVGVRDEKEEEQGKKGMGWWNEGEQSRLAMPVLTVGKCVWAGTCSEHLLCEDRVAPSASPPGDFTPQDQHFPNFCNSLPSPSPPHHSIAI